jgi:hypothetical protein
MCLLRQETAFLLDMPLRFSDMQSVHGRKFVGSHLQRSLLAVPRLWRPEAILNEKGIGWVMRPFLRFRGSRPGLFYDLSTGESCSLRIPDFVGLRFHPLLSRGTGDPTKLGSEPSPLGRWRRKGRRSPTSHLRKNLMPLQATGVGVA